MFRWQCRVNHVLPTRLLIVLMALLNPAASWAQVGLAPLIDYAGARRRLIEEVLIPGGITDARVLEAIGRTERHHFVATEYREQAYLDRARPSVPRKRSAARISWL